VIPIEESLIFVQALYLRAEGGRIPELKRVIVAYENQVVMEETLEEGLALLFGGATGTDRPAVEREAAAAAEPSPAPVAVEGTLRDLIDRAGRAYERAIEAQRSGDWARYGEEMRQVGELLRQLREAGVGGS
jgi:hypothetical protein